jgi:hypothetical protein
MWEHRNAVLHDTQLESSRTVWNAETNDAITKLYAQVDVFAAEDCWYFDVPLTLQLREPLRSRCQWLINARILANKSKQCTTIGQMTLNSTTHTSCPRGQLRMEPLSRLHLPGSIFRWAYRTYGIPEEGMAEKSHQVTRFD